jgi:large subunit ribosomal protein L19
MNTINNSKNQTNLQNKKSPSIDLIKYVESKYIHSMNIVGSKTNTLEVGDIIRLGYLIPEGDKERTQYYEGLIISKSNRNLGKSFTLRRTVAGVGVEQIFLLNSPKIVSVTKKQSSKVRRAKLYFIRSLSGKATRLKTKF